MSTPATRALAEGRMVAGLVPEVDAIRRDEDARSTRARSLPLGAQLATWRQRAFAAALARKATAKENRSRRDATWYRWTIGWVPKQGRHLATHTTHADRAALCAQHDVPNTGRQWRRLRKALARQERTS